jgi:hypothetical protein
MLIHLFNQRPKHFWSNFSTLFETCSRISSTNNFPVDAMDRNSTQLQFPFREFPFKVLFWLTHYVVPLSKLSPLGNYS